jgi:hypothetical protein
MGRSILQDFERSDQEHGKVFERSDQESFVAHSPFTLVTNLLLFDYAQELINKAKEPEP